MVSKLTRRELEKMRSVINIRDEYFVKKEYLKHLLSNMNFSEKHISELLQSCWGHGPVTFGYDVIDGPEKLFKLDCDTCMAPYIAPTEKKIPKNFCKCM